ncbi:MAG: hypothetical protein JWP65_1375, partial [Ramlibacter sp.]|uniref:lysozyme inhibitor LprI family protein n=1 Tax=Ramlibacter sp. TaxID=1917967 RepID=UPI0026254C42
MAISRREAAILVGGLLLGVAGAWALFANGSGNKPQTETVAQTRPAVAAPPSAPTTLVVAPDTCAFHPAVPSAGAGDGALRLDKDLSGKDAEDVKALLVTGKESAAAGHRRDAETAFLMACRAAGKLSGNDGVLLADASYRLGRHYALMEPAAPAAVRGELRARARTLYASSLQAYRDKYGETHEKTRFALAGLAALGGSAADVNDATAAVAPKTQAATVSAPAKAPVVAARPVEPARPAAVVTAPRMTSVPGAGPARETGAASTVGARPSFDCRNARSTTEKIICADDELARQDRELGRLHARAKAAAADPRDFQRRSDAEWSRREATCTDNACLQRWYAQRRSRAGKGRRRA